jgi:hypothetical protein
MSPGVVVEELDADVLDRAADERGGEDRVVVDRGDGHLREERQ